MWKRSELKSEARTNLKQNYWVIVAVCFLMAFLFAEYGATTTFIDSYNSDKVMRMPAAEGRMADVEENVGHLVDKTIEDGASAESKATKGVLASMAKTIGKTKGVFSAMWQTLDQFIGQHAVLSGLVALGGLLLNILFAIFVKYILQVGERRFFLENKNHPGTRIGRIGFLYMERNIKNPAMVMLMRTIFYDLWCLTIIGAPIKWYSYKMVSYIVAENPDIHWKDALALSKAMMHGNKWRTFVLDISFWYWYLIKGMTLGAFGIFFLNPYVRATETELYVSLREHVIKMRIPGYELLNDHALYLPEDIEHAPVYPGTEKEKKKEKYNRKIKIEYDRNYTIVNLIMFFFTFAIIGWLWEVSLHLVQDGVFVKRGTMHGPWLPIYGGGGVAILVLLKKVREKPALTFFLTMGLCGVIEYATSWWLEYSKGTKWWDYSGYLLNLNGRICLEGLLVFAIGGCAFVYILAPLFDDLYNKIPNRVKYPIVIVLLTMFGIDSAYSHFNPNTGPGITDYGELEYRIMGLSEPETSLAGMAEPHIKS